MEVCETIVFTSAGVSLIIIRDLIFSLKPNLTSNMRFFVNMVAHLSTSNNKSRHRRIQKYCLLFNFSIWTFILLDSSNGFPWLHLPGICHSISSHVASRWLDENFHPRSGQVCLTFFFRIGIFGDSCGPLSRSWTLLKWCLQIRQDLFWKYQYFKHIYSTMHKNVLASSYTEAISWYSLANHVVLRYSMFVPRGRDQISGGMRIFGLIRYNNVIWDLSIIRPHIQ